MNRSRHTLHGPLKAFVSTLAMLCALVQPVLALAHEQHDALHEMASSTLHDAQVEQAELPPLDREPTPGSLESLLHAFDCCLHATVISASMAALKAPMPDALLPETQRMAPLLAPLTKLLRPPILA